MVQFLQCFRNHVLITLKIRCCSLITGLLSWKLCFCDMTLELLNKNCKTVKFMCGFFCMQLLQQTLVHRRDKQATSGEVLILRTLRTDLNPQATKSTIHTCMHWYRLWDHHLKLMCVCVYAFACVFVCACIHMCLCVCVWIKYRGGDMAGAQKREHKVGQYNVKLNAFEQTALPVLRIPVSTHSLCWIGVGGGRGQSCLGTGQAK